MRNTGSLERRPLWKQIEKILRSEIGSRYPVGARLPPETELARRFKVSTLTLREALSSLDHEGLLERIQGSGTYVRDPSQGAHGFVAVLRLYHFQRLRESPFNQHLHVALSRELVHAKLQPRHYIGYTEDFQREPDFPGFLDDLESGRLRAAVSLTPYFPTKWMRLLQRRNIPLVGQNHDYPIVVRGETGKALLQSMDHLIKQGRRHFAMIGFRGPRPVTRNALDRRQDVFTEHLREHSLRVEPSWIKSDLDPCAPGAGWSVFREIWTARRQKPDALIVTDEMLFQDSAAAINDLGIAVPEALSVVTQCTAGVRLMTPFPVMTLAACPETRARRISAVVSDLLQGRTPPALTSYSACRFVSDPELSLPGRPSSTSTTPIVS